MTDPFELSDNAVPLLWELFAMPGYNVLIQRLNWIADGVVEDIVLDARNNVENPGDRYHVGRLDGAREVIKFIEELRETVGNRGAK